jgi:hypothetical protein
MTSGPLLLFRADGHAPGGELTLGSSGGTVEVQAEAKCIVPLHRLEIVLNGQVVASREAADGQREATLKEKIQVPGAGWLAARCCARRGLGTSWANMLAHTSPVYVPALFVGMYAAFKGSKMAGCPGRNPTTGLGRVGNFIF